MWSITPEDVMHLRTPGGEQFTRVVDALIRAQTIALAIPQTDVSTNQRTNVGDEGVDTEVRSGAAVDDPSGWMTTPTCWQYKATGHGGFKAKELLKELNKPYSRKLVAAGFAYRFCICDDMPAATKAKWEAALNEAARKLKHDPAPVRVVTAGDLVEQINRFPALVLRFFKPGLAKLLHLAAWGKGATRVTKAFVPVPAWSGYQQQILEHADLSKAVQDVVYAVQGKAGVGKTRLVYESLRANASLESLVLYTADENIAEGIAHELANDEAARAVLVTDECALKTRMRLRDLLGGSANRVRVISIDNHGRQPSDAAQGPWFEKLPEGDAERILEQNFPAVPDDRRREYARLARGFIRLAADMCDRDASIAAAGAIGPALPSAEEYYHARLDPEDLQVIAALSLVNRVGFRDDVAAELTALSRLVGVPREKLVQRAHTLKDSPGFVVQAGRYLYSTPDIIAQIAFKDAWDQWIRSDPDSFLRQIPKNLVQPFLERVAESSVSEEVRRIVGDFFRHEVHRLTPPDLLDIEKVDCLVELVETDPSAFLPELRRLIESASSEQLLAVNGTYRGRWGPRRALVWLAEKMAAFPEHFGDAEAILWVLAGAESEPGIGNNATGMWQGLFSVALSGTALPFSRRLELLKRRLYETAADAAGRRDRLPIALKALSDVFERGGSRLVGPGVVGGRLTPPPWRPETVAELARCWEEAVRLLVRLVESSEPSLIRGAREVGIERLTTILELGHLPALRRIFPAREIGDELLPQLISAIESFLDLSQRRAGRADTPHVGAVRRWLQELQPDNLHGRILVAAGRDPWKLSRPDRAREASVWRAELDALGQQLAANPTALGAELPWFATDQARAASLLGQAVGRHDPTSTCLEQVFAEAVKTESSAFARGYVQGFLEAADQERDQTVGRALDQLERAAPRIAFDLAMAAPGRTHAVARALRLIDEGAIPPEFLRALMYGPLLSSLKATEFKAVLMRLAPAAESGNAAAARVATDLIWSWLEDIGRAGRNTESPQASALADRDLITLVWQILESGWAGPEAPGWSTILEILGQRAPERAARVACTALVREGHYDSEVAEQLLVKLAAEHAEMVMAELGKVMLDPRRGVFFYFARFRRLFEALPHEVVIQWLRAAGVEGARKVARHLPPPHLSEAGEPIVPPLTEFVLREFEDDDRTFKEFCAGVHSLQLYSGDIAAQHGQEAAAAHLFQGHPLRRIREWALHEERSARQQAQEERDREAEELIR